MTDDKVIAIVGSAGLAIVGIGVAVVLHDSPATGAADRTAVTSTIPPTATIERASMPAPYIRKPVEQAPRTTTSMPGEGTWVVGRDLEAGVYRSQGGRTCRWARLQGGLAAPWTLATLAPQTGVQIVFLGKKDLVFTSRGCAGWVKIR